jgi:hypothetical protein
MSWVLKVFDASALSVRGASVQRLRQDINTAVLRAAFSMCILQHNTPLLTLKWTVFHVKYFESAADKSGSY